MTLLIKKRAGRRPALQNTREASDEKRILRQVHRQRWRCWLQQRAGRRPALQIQGTHQMRKGCSDRYTDRDDLAPEGSFWSILVPCDQWLPDGPRMFILRYSGVLWPNGLHIFLIAPEGSICGILVARKSFLPSAFTQLTEQILILPSVFTHVTVWISYEDEYEFEHNYTLCIYTNIDTNTTTINIHRNISIQ